MFMRTYPDECAKRFQEAYTRATNPMTQEFAIKNCKEGSFIAWDALMKFTSGS